MSPLTFHILLSLRDGPSDAEGIVLRMQAFSGEEDPPLASFYRSLKRALEEGTIAIAKPPPGEVRRGRPPQRYRITPAGEVALSAEARRLERLAALALDEPRSR